MFCYNHDSPAASTRAYALSGWLDPVIRASRAAGPRARVAKAAPESTSAPPSKNRPPIGSRRKTAPRATPLKDTKDGEISTTPIRNPGVKQERERKSNTRPATAKETRGP